MTKDTKRGFANMDPERQRELARQGGAAIPAEKRSFSKDHSLAASAGSKGGKSVPPDKRTFSRDRELAQEAGRRGGLASGARRAKQ